MLAALYFSSIYQLISVLTCILIIVSLIDTDKYGEQNQFKIEHESKSTNFSETIAYTTGIICQAIVIISLPAPLINFLARIYNHAQQR